MVHNTLRFKRLLAGLLLLAFLVTPAVPVFADSTDQKSDTNIMTQLAGYCKGVVSSKLDSACNDSGLMVRARNAATWRCADTPLTDGRKATCVLKTGKAYIDKAANKKPKTTSPTTFKNRLDTVLGEDVAETNGNVNEPEPSAGQSIAPTNETPGTPDEGTVDPAACAAQPKLEGCGTNPDAACGRNSCDLVAKYLNPSISMLTVIFGLIAMISLVMGGIQYAASNGDSQKVSNAKKRIIMTLEAIVAYAFLWGFLQFLVPGGLF